MKAIRNILLVMTLIVSILGFSQKSEKAFYPHGKTTDVPHSKRTVAGWSDTKRIPEKEMILLKDAKKASILNLLTKRQPPTTTKTVAAASPNTRKAAKQQLDSVVWYEDYKTVYTYDNAGNNVLAIDYYSGVEYFRREYKYDANGNMAEEIYDEDGSVFEYADGNLSKITYYHLNGFDWVVNSKEEYEYNTDGSIARIIYYNWDDGGNEWVKDSKDEYKYNPDGSLTSITYCYGSNYTDDWFEVFMYKYEYDANVNGKFKITYSYWDWDEDEWTDDDEEYEEYEYDSAGNLLMKAYYEWDDDDGEWYGSQYMYSYDMSFSKPDLYFSTSFEDMYNMRLKGIFSWWDGTVWTEEESESQTYYWSEHKTVGICNYDLQNTNYAVYPNPTTGKITVVSDEVHKVGSIEIYDVVGQVVFVSALSSTSPETGIDISHLAKGLYFLQIDGKTVRVVKE